MSRNPRTLTLSLIFGAALVLTSCSSTNAGPTDSDTAPDAAPGTSNGAGSGETTVDLSAANISEEAAAHVEQLYADALAAGEDTVTVYATPGQQLQPLYDAFTDMFPGITLQAQGMIGAPLNAALEAEAASNQHVADVLQNPNGPRYFDFVEPYEVESYSVPDELSDFADLLADPDHYFTAPYLGVAGLGVNTNNMDPADAPSSWSELSGDEWDGRIGVHDPSVPGVGQGTFLQLIMNGSWDEDDVSAVADYSVVKGDHAQAVQGLARGEYDVMIGAPAPDMKSMVEDGAPVEQIMMDEGNIVVTYKNMLVSGAPNPNAAKLFLEFQNFEHIQQIVAETGFTPVNADAQPNEVWSLEQANITFVPDDVETEAKTAELAPLFVELFQGR